MKRIRRWLAIARMPWLKLWRLKRGKTVKINLTQVLAIVDGAIAIAEAVANVTKSDKDNQAVAALKAWREKLRPLVGCDGDCDGCEALPETVQCAIEAACAGLEVTDE